MTGLNRPPLNGVLRIRQERWRVLRSAVYATCTVVDVAGADSGNRGQRASFVLPFETCEALPASPNPLRVSRRGWRRLARRALATATPSAAALRTAAVASIDPIPYQLEPALSYLRGDAVRLLIADAVGLGKTIQAGLVVAEMRARHRDGRALIVVPGGLRDQWRDELRARFQIDAEVLDAAGLWAATSRLPAGLNPWAAHPVVITSIDFVKRPEVLRSLEPLVWDLVVFDEAHALCGHSDRHLAASGIATRGRAIVLLTATPHSGDADAFRRLCNLGDINGRFPLLTFRRTRAQAGSSPARRSLWLALKAQPSEQRLHDALVNYARRMWSESATPGAQLAALVLLKRGASSATALERSLARRRTLLDIEPCSGPDRQRLLPLGDDDEEPASDLAWPGLVDREQELRTIDELLELASFRRGIDRKLTALSRLLRWTREPFIVFTQYRDTFDELTAALGHVPLAHIHGGMSSRERAAAARAFTQGTARVLLATDAASEGLNLQARCRLVVSFDLPWTPLRIEQRAGRVDRIGQVRSVHVWHLVASGTYEDVVANRLRARTCAAAAVLDRLNADEERDTAFEVLLGTVRAANTPTSQSAPRGSGAARTAAIEEARRVVTARALNRIASPSVPARPFVTATRRHPRRAVMAYQVVYADAEGFGSWETIAGLVLEKLRGRLARAPIDQLLCGERVRQFLADEPSLEAVHMSGQRRMAAVALRRDRAIEQVLRSERARLSAALLQPELFSKRAERAVTPQLQLLDESLQKLRDASSRTRAAGHFTVESVSPLFGALLP